MRVVLGIGGSGRALALTVRGILQAQAEGVAREILGGRSLPPLYSSGIRYRPEPTRGTGTEYFDDPWTCLQRGWADCDDAVVYRCGELLAAGESATVICMWRWPRLHVAVRRADQRAEDPSKILIAKYGR